MRRTLIKVVLIAIVSFVGMVLFSILRVSGSGVLPLATIAIGTLAADKAIWKYNPEGSKEISLQKDD